MKKLLFSPDGRLNRAGFWKVMLIYICGTVAYALALVLLWQIIPGEVAPDGTFHVSGIAALPYIFLTFGFIGASFWLCICAGVKRYHDRDKSGLWVLIQFVPLVGSLWYLIEVGFLRGTSGPNRYGPDPVPGGGL